MNPNTKPFLLSVTVKNNRLVQLREELGLSLAEFSRKAGVSLPLVSALEDFKGSPWCSNGWTPAALQIAKFHGVSPDFLWPKEVAMVSRNNMTLEVGASEIRALSQGRRDVQVPVDIIDSVQLAG